MSGPSEAAEVGGGGLDGDDRSEVTQAASDVDAGAVTAEGRALSADGDAFEGAGEDAGPRTVNDVPPSDDTRAFHAAQPTLSREAVLSGLAQIGPNGVRIEGGPLTTSELFQLSERTGNEYALTLQVNPDDPHDRTYRIYEGDAWSVATPTGAGNLSERPVAHTHPNLVDGHRFPSAADMHVAQTRYDALVAAGLSPDAAVERQLVVHGQGPDGVTLYASGPGRDLLYDEEGRLVQGQTQPGEVDGDGRARAPGLVGAALIAGEATVTIGDRMREGETFGEAVTGVASELMDEAYQGLVGEPHERGAAAYERSLALVEQARESGALTGLQAEALELAVATTYLGGYAHGVGETVLGEEVIGQLERGEVGAAARTLVGNTLSGVTEGGADLVGGVVDHGLAFVGAEQTGAAARQWLNENAEWLTGASAELADDVGAFLAEQLGLDRSAETAEERAARLDLQQRILQQPMP